MAEFDKSAVLSRYGRLPKNDDEIRSYAQAVKIVVGADGQIPPAEAKAMRMGLERLGASKKLVEEIEKFDHSKAKLEDVLKGFRKGGVRARALLRDAIDISQADGHYAKEERNAAAKAAKLLGVDDATLGAIEALVKMEHGVSRLQKALFPRK